MNILSSARQQANKSAFEANRILRIRQIEQAIAQLQANVKAQQDALGQAAYALHRAGELDAPKLLEACQQIDSLQAQIQQQVQQIEAIRAERPPEPARPQETLRCPSCQKPIPQEAVFCPHCGSPTRPAPTASAASVVCAKCGNQAPAGSAFCPRCGSPIPPPRATSVVCPHCGNQAPAESLFCPSCGKPIAQKTGAPPA